VLEKRSFSIAGHRTSVALEPDFWAALTRLAESRAQTLGRLVAGIDAQRQPDENLASALRIAALRAAAR
jgi:predicted DNA-binding ribbon-helix-helix protein